MAGKALRLLLSTFIYSSSSDYRILISEAQEFSRSGCTLHSCLPLVILQSSCEDFQVNYLKFIEDTIFILISDCHSVTFTLRLLTKFPWRRLLFGNLSDSSYKSYKVGSDCCMRFRAPIAQSFTLHVFTACASSPCFWASESIRRDLFRSQPRR